MVSDREILGRIAFRAAEQVACARPQFIEAKAADDFVTDLDRRLEAEIFEDLGRHFPGVPMLGEESLVPGQRLPEDCFLVDPLDGTSNWIAGISFCGISIARVTNGRTICSAVADATTGTVYAAARGGGAFKNGARLMTKSNPDKLFGLSTGALEAMWAEPSALETMRRFGKFRNLGAQSLQLCLVAEGALVFSASIEARLWDDAAGRLIVTEAGARYSHGVAEDGVDLPATKQRSLAVHASVAEDVTQFFGAFRIG